LSNVKKHSNIAQHLVVTEKDIENLFNQHHKTMLYIAYKIVFDKAATEDIVQDVFLRIWKRRGELDPNLFTKSYLYKSTVNMALDYLKKNKRLVALQPDILQPQAHKSERPDEIISLKELQEKIDGAIELLPPKCKTIFVLSRFEDMKYREIADVLNISQKTVEAQMSIALKKLRKDLKPFLKGGFLSTVIIFCILKLLYM